MKKVLEKIIAIILILLLLMPNILVFAADYDEIPEGEENTETVSYNSIYKFSIENYLLKNGYDLDNDNHLSDEELSKIEELEIDNSYYTDTYDNMVVLDIKKLEKLENLKKLTISFEDFKEIDMEVISKLKNLEEFHLDTSKLESLKGWNTENLSKLENLKALRIYSEHLKAFELVGGLNKLEYLNIQADNLETLKISNLPNLKNLDITSYNLANWDINNLENLNVLHLNVGVYDSENINSILGFTNLESLGIYGNYFTEDYAEKLELNLSNISNLKQLKNLDISSYNVTDLIITPETELTNLEHLGISIYGLRKFEFSNIENVKRLSISAGALSEQTVDKIFNLPNIIDLDFSLSNITNDSNEFINQKTINISENLEELSFSLYGNFEKIKLTSQATQTKLRRLYVHASNTNDFSIKNINSIDYIYMTVNSLTQENMADIAKLTLLYDLNIYCENLSLENVDLSTLQNLIFLSIQADSITTFDASCLEKLQVLDSLTISCYNLAEIKNLEKLNTLEYLYIYSNLLEKIEFKSAGLNSLRSMNISSDKLKNFNLSNGAAPNLIRLFVYAYNLETFKIENDSLEYLEIESYTSENVDLQISNLKNLMELDITSYTKDISGIKFETLTKLNDLNLYLPNVENIIFPSTGLDNVQSLSISASTITSFKVSNETMPNLLNLSISGNDLNNLEISNIDSLIGLSVNALNLTDLSKIKYNTLPNLKSLSLNLNEFEEVDISSLNNLEYLTLRISKLAGLKLSEQSKIKELTLYCSDIAESVLNEIYKLNYLTELEIECDKMSNFDTSIQSGEEPILPKLEKLSISNDYYSDTGVINNLKIADLKSLKDLEINGTTIQNLKLENLEELIELNLNCDKLENWDTSSIEKSKKMEKMSIECSGLTSIDLAPIGNIRNLGGLTIVLNNIANDPDVTPLKKLVNLQYLYVEYNDSVFEEVQEEILSVGLKYRDIPIFEKNLTDTQKYLYGFDFNKYGDTVTTFEERLDYSVLIESANISNPNIKLYNSAGEELTENQIVGTSDILKIFDGEEVKFEYTIIYFGDVNGDGRINAIDSLTIVKNKLTEEGDEDYFRFSNIAYEEAGRIITEEGTPSANDGLAIVKHALDLIKIDQYK